MGLTSTADSMGPAKKVSIVYSYEVKGPRYAKLPLHAIIYIRQDLGVESMDIRSHSGGQQEGPEHQMPEHLEE